MAQIIAVISMFLLATKHLYEFVAISTAGGSVSLKQSKYRLAQCHTSIITLESWSFLISLSLLCFHDAVISPDLHSLTTAIDFYQVSSGLQIGLDLNLSVLRDLNSHLLVLGKEGKKYGKWEFAEQLKQK